MRRQGENASDGRWTLPGCHVQAGEAREDAALRLLEQNLGIVGLALGAGRQIEHMFDNITLFHAVIAGELPKNTEKDGEEYMFLDRDELTGLHEHFCELLAAELIFLLQNSYLWPLTKSSRKA